MPIAYDNATKSVSSENVNSLTFSHTNSSSANRGIILFVWDQTSSITGATYAGIGMTRIFSDNSKEAFYLANPASGANNIVISRSSTATDILVGMAISFTGVNISSMIGNTSGSYTQTDTSTTPHYDFTTANDNSIVATNPWGGGYPALGVTGTGHTERCTDEYATGGTLIATTKTTTSAGSYEIMYTSNPSKKLYLSLVEVKELVITVPTLSTSSADQLYMYSVRGNGNITATGGANSTRRGFCYKEGASGDPTTSDSTAYDDGDYGTGAYTKTITGLKANTTYRVRAYAVNSAGTGYGSTVSAITDQSGRFFLLFQ